MIITTKKFSIKERLSKSDNRSFDLKELRAKERLSKVLREDLLDHDLLKSEDIQL